MQYMLLLNPMTASLLREYLALVMEKIRTKKGQKGMMGDKFSLKKFKSFDNYNVELAYAQKFLDLLGQGSSRAAFMLTNKYVLKIALNAKGIGQNEAEVDVYTNAASKAIVAKIYDSDPNYHWIISEVVKPIKDVKEFETLAGIDWKGFSDYINHALHKDNPNKGATDDTMPKFVQAVIQTAHVNKLLRGDLAQQDWSHEPTKDVLDHWGKSADGRIVLLDYGYTEGVWDKHYRSRDEAFNGKSAAPDAATKNPGGAEKHSLGSQKTMPRVVVGDKNVDGGEKTMRSDVAAPEEKTNAGGKPKPQPKPQSGVNPNDVKTTAPPRKAAVNDVDRDAKTKR